MPDSHHWSNPPHRTTIIIPSLIRRNKGAFWGKNREHRRLYDFWREMAEEASIQPRLRTAVNHFAWWAKIRGLCGRYDVNMKIIWLSVIFRAG
jgi:hypothetical protein